MEVQKKEEKEEKKRLKQIRREEKEEKKRDKHRRKEEKEEKKKDKQKQKEVAGMHTCAYSIRSPCLATWQWQCTPASRTLYRWM